ncbi:MAG: hypothetical protein LBP32_04850 [Spirochaetaceae bacterium]|jgi:electron transport complex protein RnfA|nr:hypothetical protein [Spirochaetaceae bacterium]
MDISLAVFSGMFLNLILQFGLGTGVLMGGSSRRIRWFPWTVLFLSVLILWFFFARVLSSLSLGFLEYFLLVPLSSLVCRGLEAGGARFREPRSGTTPFTPGSAYNGLALAALILTLALARSFTEAAILSLGFSLGALLAVLTLNELYRRSSMETVPRFIRGAPLILISMGLLSLIFSSGAVFFLNALEH